MKKSFFILFVLLGATLYSKSVLADFDAANFVPTKLVTVQEQIQSGVRYVDKQITELRELAKYDPRNLVDIEKDFIEIPKIPKIEAKIPDFFADINDNQETAKDLKKNVISQISIETNSTTDVDRKEFLDAKSQRMDDFSDLYAKAFTTRTNLAREDFETKKRTSTQSILKSATTVDNRILVRFNNIQAMNMAYAEYMLKNQSLIFKNVKEEDADE